VSSNAERAAILTRALRSRFTSDRAAIDEIYTDDVRAWTPALSVTSRTELLVEFDRHDDAFSDVAVDVFPLDTGGEHACAEWSVTMTHSGPLEVGAGVVEPTGSRITLHGVTVAEFRGDRICSFRQYWDELAIFEQLGLVPAEDDGPHHR
jgi:ketosteroid isomerase-like protein